MPVTAIVSCPLAASADVRDPYKAAEAEVVGRLEARLEERSPQSVHFGRQNERPDMLEVLITYEKDEVNHDWIGFLGEYSAHQDGGENAVEAVSGCHVDLKPFDNLEPAVECPVTEVAKFYFRGEPPAEYLNIFQEFRAAAEQEKGCGLLASAGGITHEEVEFNGTKGKAAVFVAGWQSVEAHKDFKNTRTYKEHMPKMKHWISNVDACHVSFRRLV
ncbi:hypothetical protein PRZ48_010453 [Zasmidium cellare]|uniref:ABM domain-containing protein n=1 Tax=Zasmidium cellare TaxID=395010 RepID=A0ABR0E8P3_ZASCE|nr:hypothetical protein PRZ48_010453 [Zasmidium cellare]